MTTTTEETFQHEVNRHYASFEREVSRQIRIMDKAQALGHDEWADSIRESILEDPLSVGIDTIDPGDGTVMWTVLLGWGGPAMRILVETDMDGRIINGGVPVPRLVQAVDLRRQRGLTAHGAVRPTASTSAVSA